jgi:MoaA/NifB/PqqE/SkfB family radical SAM enzyme
MFEWIELALDYRCNLRCIGCRACVDTGESLTGARIRTLLETSGVKKLWIGGGEPTLRDDLLAVVATARKLGYERILLQTNGLRLAYPSYVEALVRAGVTDVSVNVKSHRAEVHDALSGRDGAHELLLRALDNLRRHDVRLLADLLVTRTTGAELPETIEWFAARGIARFTLWLLSAVDVQDPVVEGEVPRIADLPLVRASEMAERLGVELASLHTPPCTLPSAARHRFLPAKELRLRIVDPSGRAFALEESPFEGGAFQPPCGHCSERGRCNGPRADYIRLHGDREIAAI